MWKSSVLSKDDVALAFCQNAIITQPVSVVVLCGANTSKPLIRVRASVIVKGRDAG